MSEEHQAQTAASDVSITDGLVPEEEMEPFARRALRRALTVVWLAIILGIAVQLIVLGVRLYAGASFDGLQFAATCAQGISWSVLVCGAVSIGTVISRARGAIMGLLGLIAGPIAWGLAKGVQKGVQSLLGVAEDPISTFFFQVSAIKGVEYAILGAALGFMVGRKWANVWTHVLLGLVVGSAFAALFVSMNLANATALGKPFPMPAMAGLIANELVFPIGCSLVIYAVQHMRGQVERVQKIMAK